MKKFTEMYDVSDYEVETPDGFVSIDKTCKTIPYEVITIVTNNGYELQGADKHIVITEAGGKSLENIIPFADKVKTKDGFSEVVLKTVSGCSEEMYDLALSPTHIYWTDGIASHNTTITTAYLTHRLLFSRDQRIMIMAHVEERAKETLRELKYAYERLPTWMQHGVVSWAKTYIELENSSKLAVSSPHSTSTIGGTYNELYLDEFAKIPNTIAREFIGNIFPTVISSNSSKIIITSTPYGLNHFYKLWQDAKLKRNTFATFEAKWNCIPGRDKKFKEETIKALSGGEREWRQHFECQFIGEQNTLVDENTIINMVYKEPLITNSQEGTETVFFSRPEYGRKYILLCDASEGVGQDDCCIQVLDITTKPYTQVARFSSNTVRPQMFPKYINTLGKLFFDAYVVLEVNDVGGIVSNILYRDYSYENLITDPDKRRNKDARYGVHMNVNSKKNGCSNIAQMIENNDILLQDIKTISQLSTFVKKNRIGYGASDGEKDDMVTPLVTFGYLMGHSSFKEMIETHEKEYLLRDSELREELQDASLGLAKYWGFSAGSNEKPVSGAFIEEDGIKWQIVRN